ncbi:MAG: hypothetical protein M3303_13720 [Gemmatimonadota bacterium]|nr:hypothetical protein [Gemmatimonadota bacterium]
MRPNHIPTRVAACLAVLAALAHDAAAQDAVTVRHDARVRVVALGRDGQPNRVLQAGALRQLDGDTVIIATSGALHRVLVDSSRRLEVSYNSRRRTGTGALIGFVVGGVLGFVAPCDDGQSGFGAPTCEDLRPAVAGLLGVVGAGVGALIGFNRVRDDWQPLRQPWKVGVNTGLPTQVVVRVTIGR